MTAEEAKTLKIGDLVIWDPPPGEWDSNRFPRGTILEVSSLFKDKWINCIFTQEVMDSSNCIRTIGSELNLMENAYLDNIQKYFKKAPEPLKKPKTRFELILDV